MRPSSVYNDDDLITSLLGHRHYTLSALLAFFIYIIITRGIAPSLSLSYLKVAFFSYIINKNNQSELVGYVYATLPLIPLRVHAFLCIYVEMECWNLYQLSCGH